MGETYPVWLYVIVLPSDHLIITILWAYGYTVMSFILDRV